MKQVVHKKALFIQRLLGPGTMVLEFESTTRTVKEAAEAMVAKKDKLRSLWFLIRKQTNRFW